MKLFEGICKNNFLSIGRVGIDFFPDPPGTKTENAQKMSVGMGGSSANIAAGIVKLDGKASLVTSVSKDAIGRYCFLSLWCNNNRWNRIRFRAGENLGV